MAADITPAAPSYDALLLIAQSVAGALSRAGLTDCDDPGEAIDVLRERYEVRIAELLAATAAGGAPSIEASHEMGAKGGPVVEAERLTFEAWMRGHCWALCATWDGKGYVSDVEQAGGFCAHASNTRRLWAAWRDRAALGASAQAEAQPASSAGRNEYRVSAGPATGWSPWFPGTGDRFEAEYQVERRTAAAEAEVAQPVAWHIEHPDGLVALRKRDSVDEHMVKQAAADGVVIRPLVFGDAAPPAQPQAPAAAVPEELRTIGHLIATQDNRITDAPIFIVQQKIVHVAHPDYDHDRIVWVDADGEATAEEIAALDAQYAASGKEPDGWTRAAIGHTWEFVTACFTEQGCKDYIERNGHNLREHRIYAASSFRNKEWRTVRSFLLAAAPAPGVSNG